MSVTFSWKSLNGSSDIMYGAKIEMSVNIKIKDQNIWEEGFDVKPLESNELKFTKVSKPLEIRDFQSPLDWVQMPWERDSSWLSWAVALFGNLSMFLLHHIFKLYFLFFLQFVLNCRKIVVLPYLKEGAFISAPAATCNCLNIPHICHFFYTSKNFGE